MALCKDGKLKCCVIINNKLFDAFKVLGKFIGGHPWKIILLTLFVNTVFALCVFWVEKELHLDEQFRPSGSQAQKDKDHLASVTNYQYRYERQLIDVNKYVEIIYSPGGIVNPRSADNHTATFSSLFGSTTCPTSRRYGSRVCGGLDSVIVYYCYAFVSYPSNSNQVSYPYIFSNEEQTNIYYAQYVKSRSNISDLSSIVGLKWIYWPKFRDAEHLRHFGTMLENVKNTYTMPFVYADDLRNETLYEDFKDAAVRFVGAFILMNGLGLVAIWSANNNNIGNPALLIAVQLVSTAMAACCGVGFWVLLNVKINVFALTLVPLMSQVMGLIRLFLQIATLYDGGKQKSTKQQIGSLMGRTGVALTLSYLFEWAVILAASLSSFPGLRHTCFYLGTVGFMAFVNQMTFVPACFALYESRARLGLHCIFCFPISRKKEKPYSQFNIKDRVYAFFCSGKVPRSKEDTDSYFDKFLRFILQRAMANRIFKMIVVCLYVVYVCFMIWQTILMEQQDKVQRMGSPSSNIRRFFDNDVGFYQTAYISFTIYEPIQYTSSQNQQYIQNLIREAQNDQLIHDSYSINWLDFYMNNYTGLYSYNSSSEFSFINNLYFASIYSSSMYNFAGDYHVTGVNGQVTFSRFYVLGVDLKNTKAKADLMSRMRKIASESPLPVTAYSPHFVKYEQYASILPECLKTLGIPTLCFVFFLCLFLPVDIFSIVYMAVTSVTYVVCVFGAMSIFTIHYNFVTMISVIIMFIISTVIASVVCIGHAHNGHKDNAGHVNQTIETAVIPILKVCLCVMIGLFCIIDSDSYVLYAIFCIFMIGFVNIIFHHVILYPVLISLIGGKFRSKVHPALFSSNSTSKKLDSVDRIFWTDSY